MVSYEPHMHVFKLKSHRYEVQEPIGQPVNPARNIGIAPRL